MWCPWAPDCASSAAMAAADAPSGPRTRELASAGRDRDEGTGGLPPLQGGPRGRVCGGGGGGGGGEEEGAALGPGAVEGGGAHGAPLIAPTRRGLERGTGQKAVGE